MGTLNKNRRAAAGQQYAIIVGLIAVLGLAAVSVTGGNIKALFSKTANTLGGVTNATSAAGSGAAPGPASFAFTTQTFTPCTATGKSGPSLGNCQTAYSNPEAANWKTNASFYTVSGGIQRWMVPETGNYRITARGAQGGCVGGNPTTMAGDFALTQGTILHLVVGQIGGCNSTNGGGGGGSYVVAGGTTPLIVAGGGGGAGGATFSSATMSLNAPDPGEAIGCGAGRGGTNGGGGGGGANYGSGGGGGYYTDGGSAGYNSYNVSGGVAGTQSTPGGDGGGTACTGSGGKSFLNGSVGGGGSSPGSLNCYSTGYPTADGGFGGGGTNGAGNSNGGGGGGWSGGAGGHFSSNGCGGGHIGQSTGGGSYNTGTNQSNAIGGTGDGIITITKL